MLKPLTIVVGKNSSGKSTLLRTFPLFKQTLETKMSEPILWYGRYVDFGDFKESKSKFSNDNTIDFEYEFYVDFGLICRERYFFASFEEELKEKDMRSTKVVLCIDESAVRSVKIIIEEIQIELLYHKGNNAASVKINGHDCDDVSWKVEQEIGNIIPKVVSDPELMSSPSVYFFWRFEQDLENSLKNDPLFSLINSLLKDIIADSDRIIYMKAIYSCLLENGLDFGEKYECIRTQLAQPQRDAMLHSSRNNARKIKHMKEDEIDAIICKLKQRQEEIKRYIIMFYLPQIISTYNSYFSRYFRNVKYIAPVRATAERYYRKQGLDLLEVDARGENVSTILQNMKQAEARQFNEWLNKEFGFKLTTKTVEGHISIYIANGSDSTNIADAGFGYSQILPILLLLWKSRNRGAEEIPEIQIVIEQPELHLHPKMQNQLLELIVMMISENPNIRFLLETHSEVLINYLGALIANNSIDHSEVSILLIEQKDRHESMVRNVNYDKMGYLEQWPIDFFTGDN